MPPAERRKAIIEATLPLIQQQGTNVSTRQVAEAAGVAEGTIFRVFDSMQDLIQASILAAFSREALDDFLSGVDLGDTLEEKTHATLSLLKHRIDTIRSLMMVVHQAEGSPGMCIRDGLSTRRDELDAWLVERFAVHAPDLRVPPEQYVSFLRLLATGSSLHLDAGLDADAAASLALHGALRKEHH